MCLNGHIRTCLSVTVSTGFIILLNCLYSSCAKLLLIVLIFSPMFDITTRLPYISLFKTTTTTTTTTTITTTFSETDAGKERRIIQFWLNILQLL